MGLIWGLLFERVTEMAAPDFIAWHCHKKSAVLTGHRVAATDTQYLSRNMAGSSF